VAQSISHAAKFTSPGTNRKASILPLRGIANAGAQVSFKP